MSASLRDVPVGTALPSLVLPPLTRAQLALYAGGSGDHIPLHIDSDFAKAAGHPDVFMHGMLGVAFLMRLVTQWVPPEAVVAWEVRFTAITWPGESLVAAATLEAREGETATLQVRLHNADGETKIAGSATVLVGRDP